METVEQLKKEREQILSTIRAVQDSFSGRLKEIDDLLWIDEIRKARQLVGKCFKAKNSYSVPENEKDTWYAYFKIIAINSKKCEDGDSYYTFSILRVEQYPNEDIIIKTDREAINLDHFYLLRDHDFEKITQREFEAAYRKIIKSLNKGSNEREEQRSEEDKD